MDAKEQIIKTLQQEIGLLKMENEFLHHTCAQLNGGRPIQIPQNIPSVSVPRMTPGFERA